MTYSAALNEPKNKFHSRIDLFYACADAEFCAQYPWIILSIITTIIKYFWRQLYLTISVIYERNACRWHIYQRLTLSPLCTTDNSDPKKFKDLLLNGSPEKNPAYNFLEIGQSHGNTNSCANAFILNQAK